MLDEGGNVCMVRSGPEVTDGQGTWSLQGL